MHPPSRRGAALVNETFARRLTSFDIGGNGLANRQTVAEFGPGTFPDGLAFDETGDAWITSIISNRVLRVGGKGQTGIFLEDVDQAHLEWAEKAYRRHEIGRPHLDKTAGRKLRNVSNLAFCGPDLDQAVLGCLLGDSLATLKMPVKGHRPVHWTFDIAPLINILENEPEVLEPDRKSCWVVSWGHGSDSC